MSTLSDATTVHFSRGIPPLEAIPSEELADHTALVLEEPAATRSSSTRRSASTAATRLLREQLGAFQASTPSASSSATARCRCSTWSPPYCCGDGGDANVERPTYDRAVGIVERHGGRLLSVPLEADGIDVELLRERLPDRPTPAFLYTIPTSRTQAG